AMRQELAQAFVPTCGRCARQSADCSVRRAYRMVYDPIRRLLAEDIWKGEYVPGDRV
ncbi:MAG: hypothetical protein AVDCRST_MAG93-4086, partial [uncultured Chloroflexia bacterium]